MPSLPGRSTVPRCVLAAVSLTVGTACSAVVTPVSDAAPVADSPVGDASDVVPAGSIPCGPHICGPAEACVHQGFMEDGGFRPCDDGCGPIADAAAVSCATVGAYYCRLDCFTASGRVIYCDCE